MASAAAAVAAADSFDDLPSKEDIKKEFYGLLEGVGKLLDYTYVETDETIGPQVGKFEQAERQLQVIGRELTRLRDATSATHAAHVELAQLCEGGSGVPGMRTFGERQEAQARLSQSLAASYDRFVSISVNQLEGLAGVVANKYKAYCSKVIEMRRRKEQLQLLVKQRERSELRTLERSLIPAASRTFRADMEGVLFKMSPLTKIWWSCYARLDRRQKVLIFTNRKDEPPSAASKAVALSKYVLCHELPEHHAKRAAAFEIVPLQTELPFITLSADGTLEARRWVCALQEAMDRKLSEADEAPPLPSDAVYAAEAADAAEVPSPMPPMPVASTRGPEVAPSPLKPLADKFDQLVDFSSSKLDELDRHFSGTLAEQSKRTSVQLAALADERRVAGEQFLTSLDEFSSAMAQQMADELIRIAEAQLTYHSAMVAHLQQLTASLKTRRADDASAAEASGGSSSSRVVAAPAAAAAAAPAAAAAAPSAAAPQRERRFSVDNPPPPPPKAPTTPAPMPAPPPPTTPATTTTKPPTTTTTTPAAGASLPAPAAAPVAAATGLGALGPAWTRGELERPAGEKDMGGWKAAVYTEEQQVRLGIDAEGHPAPQADSLTNPAPQADSLTNPAPKPESSTVDEADETDEPALQPESSTADVVVDDDGAQSEAEDEIVGDDDGAAAAPATSPEDEIVGDDDGTTAAPAPHPSFPRGWSGDASFGSVGDASFGSVGDAGFDDTGDDAGFGAFDAAPSAPPAEGEQMPSSSVSLSSAVVADDPEVVDGDVDDTEQPDEIVD